MAEDRVNQFLGGSPGSVFIRLALLCLLVGALLAAFGLTPWGLIHFIRYSIEDLIGSGMHAVHTVAGFIISGAVIVVPIWLIVRLLSKRG